MRINAAPCVVCRRRFFPGLPSIGSVPACHRERRWQVLSVARRVATDPDGYAKSAGGFPLSGSACPSTLEQSGISSCVILPPAYTLCHHLLSALQRAPADGASNGPDVQLEPPHGRFPQRDPFSSPTPGGVSGGSGCRASFPAVGPISWSICTRSTSNLLSIE